MRNLVIGILIGALGFFAYQRYQARSRPVGLERTAAEYGGVTGSAPEPAKVEVEYSAPAYRCDGRQHCSQMKSCEEAKWMLKHCPDMKMDGDNDGWPCENKPC